MGGIMTSSSCNTSENRLLRALTPPDLERLRPHLIDVDLPIRKVLSRPGEHVDSAYFVGSGFVSMVQTLSDGTMVEVGLIGREGFVGVHVILGSDSSPSETMVQMAGHGWQMSLSVLRAEMETNKSFRNAALLYAQALNVQITYSAVCNARHSIAQRLARWLSAARDHVETDDIDISHELLAMMLGCRRAGVTEAIGILRTSNLITSKAGTINIRNRVALAEGACGCYHATKAEYANLFSETASTV